MNGDIAYMSIEELQAQHDRLLNEMIMIGSPSFFTTNGKCYSCDWDYQSKLKTINHQLEIAKKVKTMNFSFCKA